MDVSEDTNSPLGQPTRGPGVARGPSHTGTGGDGASIRRVQRGAAAKVDWNVGGLFLHCSPLKRGVTDSPLNKVRDFADPRIHYRVLNCQPMTRGRLGPVSVDKSDADGGR